MKNHNRTILAGLATLLLASCGSDNSSAGNTPTAVRACEIVPVAEISRIAGAALIESNVDVERTDGTGYGSEFAEAIEAGSDIQGLGDAAYTFEIHETLFVVAYKDKHVEVRVWAPIGKDGKAWALQTVKAIAAAALQNL